MGDDSYPDEHARHQLADRVSFVVYGTIAVLAAVGGLTLETKALHAREAAVVLMVVAISAWLAHAVWRVVRARARRDAVPDRSHELYELLRSWPILASGLPAAAAMCAAIAGAWSVSTGLRVAQGLGIAVLLVAGLVTARLAGANRFAQLVYVLVLPSVGLLVVALEVAAHHV